MTESDEESYEKVVDKLLEDPASKSWLLQKLGLDGEEETDKNHPPKKPVGEDPPKDPKEQPGSKEQGTSGNLTLSGKSAGTQSNQWPFPPYWWPPYPSYPTCSGDSGAPSTSGHTPFLPPFLPQWFQQAGNSREERQDHGNDGEIPGPSGLVSKPDKHSETDEDVIKLLDESEALELVEFDPSVSPKDSWEPPKTISGFLEKHFNRALADSEREAIMKDFPKPACEAMAAPKLDDEVKDQLKKKGKDPHFGAEKSLYKIQEQLLDVAGPLTCLWADLLNKQAEVSPEDILLLIPKALVLLGSASHSISQERRKNCVVQDKPAVEIASHRGVF